MKDIVIIGAGIGGLSAAIQLAHLGHKVKIIEKNHIAGGKVLQIRHNGFTFDAGASFITLKKVYEDFFRQVDKRLEDYITLTPMSTSTTFHFFNGKTLSFFPDSKRVREEIAQRFPGEENGFDKFMAYGRAVYDIMYHGPSYGARNYHHLMGFDYLFNPRIVKDISILRPWQTWDQLVRSCFRSEQLRAAFSYQSTFVGAAADQTLAAFSFLTYLEIAEGMYEVQGGVYAIVEGLVKLAQELGVEFYYDQEVLSLEERGASLFVTTQKLRIRADIVVNNTDAPYFYKHIYPQYLKNPYPLSYVKTLKQSNGYFTINLGLKKPLPHIAHHTFFLSKNWEEFTHLIFDTNTVQKITPENITYYVVQKSLYQKWMAPKGKATLFILVPTSGYNPGFDWKAYKNTFTQLIYDTMEKRDGIDIRKYIEEEIIMTPEDWGKRYNLWENILLGPSLTFFQANGFRLSNKDKHMHTLYHVGTSTIPGPSIPACLTSGMLVASRIQEELS